MVLISLKSRFQSFLVSPDMLVCEIQTISGIGKSGALKCLESYQSFIPMSRGIDQIIKIQIELTKFQILAAYTNLLNFKEESLKRAKLFNFTC